MEERIPLSRWLSRLIYLFICLEMDVPLTSLYLAPSASQSASQPTSQPTSDYDDEIDRLNFGRA